MRTYIPRRFVAAFSGTLLATAGLVTLMPAATASAGTPTGPGPIVQHTSNQVTADRLPTEQIDNGVVWSIAVNNGIAYAGGEFSNVRPPGAAQGTSLTPRGNLMAVNLSTGALVTSFAPSLNAQVKAVAVSPDGSTLYVGGSFTTANGQAHSHVAAYNIATGQLINGFNANTNGLVNAIAATNSTVYVGGTFSAARGQTRTRLAAFRASDGALLDWAPTADNDVDALLMSPDGSRLIVGGAFANINGAQALGSAALDPSTGASLPWALNQTVYSYNGTHPGAILSLSTDGTSVYGTAWNYGSPSNFEGTFSADPDTGTINWLEDCHGDTYGTYPMNGAIYVVSHEHFCSNVGAFPETNPRTWHRTTAFTTNATGVLTHNQEAGAGYGDFGGEPSPSQINWYPNIPAGTYTGQSQAAWAVSGNDKYVVEGGEFPTVNGTAQYGLVRFGVPSVAPNKRGPNIGGTQPAVSPSAVVTNGVHISWAANWDPDDLNLTYSLYRTDKGSTPIYQTTTPATFWNEPTMSYTDTSVTAGNSYTYYLRTTDPSGNAQKSSNITVTAPSTFAASPYADDVIGAQASHYWRLDGGGGTSTDYDWAGGNNLALGSGITTGAQGAISGDSDTAATFSGSSSASAGSQTSEPGPNTFSVGSWFKTTSRQGGKIVGFGNARTGSSSSYDRHIYMDNAGHLVFGVYNNGSYTIISPKTYNDGQWHQVVGTLSGAGMVLYIDGKKVGTNSGTTVGQAYSGYWRVGGDNLGSWPNHPSSSYFAGAIDEVAIYPSALTLAQVQTQYTDSGRTLDIANQAPTASFTKSCTNLGCSFDGSGSSDPDGTVAGYAWGFGDGTNDTGATTQHTYSTTGTYTVTLTVTDNDGATNTTSQTVQVAPAANQPPTASFTNSCTYLACSFDASTSSDPDGTIAGYAWNFGDGATGSGAGPQHTYTAAGSYTVKVTVTDNNGATGTATHTVQVAANQPPTASYSYSCSAFACSFDASSSSDADGTIAHYDWDFGDGSQGIGVTPSHTYTQAGMHSVKLTVTDDQGATDTSTQQVSVSAVQTYAADAFGRTVSKGWDSADTGGAYTVIGSQALLSVGNGYGLMTLGAGNAPTAMLNDVSASDLNWVTDVTTSAQGTGNGITAVLIARNTASGNYRLKLRFLPNGVVNLVICKVLNGSETVLKEITVPDLTYNAGDILRVRFTVSGTSPTTLTGAVWNAGSGEPANPQISVTDLTAALQAPGSVGIQSTLASNATNWPVSVKYKQFTVNAS